MELIIVIGIVVVYVFLAVELITSPRKHTDYVYPPLPFMDVGLDVSWDTTEDEIKIFEEAFLSGARDAAEEMRNAIGEAWARDLEEKQYKVIEHYNSRCSLNFLEDDTDDKNLEIFEDYINSIER